MRIAGFLSFDPRPFTFRDLFVMAEGKRFETWNFWSSSFAMTANCNRDPKKTRPFSPEMFHPYLAAKAREKRRQGLGDFLAAMKSTVRKNRFSRLAS